MAKQAGTSSKKKKTGGTKGRSVKNEAAEMPASKKRPRAEAAPVSSSNLAKPTSSDPVSMETINRLVDKIVALDGHARIEHAYAIGELVVTELFDGDVALLHQPGPKAHALASLGLHKRLPFSPATLSRSVGVYELLERFPQFRGKKGLAVGHLYAVLAVPVAKQAALLAAAVEKEWEVDRLEEEAAKARPKEGDGRRGRPPLPPGIKELGAIERLLTSESKFEDLSFVEELDEKQIKVAKEMVDKMRAWCTQAEESIDRRLKTVEAYSDE